MEALARVLGFLRVSFDHPDALSLRRHLRAFFGALAMRADRRSSRLTLNAPLPTAPVLPAPSRLRDGMGTPEPAFCFGFWEKAANSGGHIYTYTLEQLTAAPTYVSAACLESTRLLCSNAQERIRTVPADWFLSLEPPPLPKRTAGVRFCAFKMLCRQMVEIHFGAWPL